MVNEGADCDRFALRFKTLAVSCEIIRERSIPKESGSILAARINSTHVASWLCTHIDYRAAKSGDALAALRLVCDLIPKDMLRSARNRWPGAVFLFASANEGDGLNLIPAALAWHLAQPAGGDVAFLTQLNRVGHTGASAAHRLANQPSFAGQIEYGRRYVLVDDVAVLGGTLAQMANLVLGQGGEIAGVAVVVNATRSEHLWPTISQINLLRSKYQNDLEAVLSIKTEALTRPEANYLAGFRSLESVRDRIARARDESSARPDARRVSQEPARTIRLKSGVIETLIDAADVLEGDPDLEQCPIEEDPDAEPDGATFIFASEP